MAIIDKPLPPPGIVSGPTTWSKYAQALADIINKDDKYPPRVALTITELAGVVLDDDPKVALEFANEIFNADSGQMLKYQKLLSHPNIVTCGCICLQMNLGNSRKALVTK